MGQAPKGREKVIKIIPHFFAGLFSYTIILSTCKLNLM
jgi:hypothetical protein